MINCIAYKFVQSVQRLRSFLVVLLMSAICVTNAHAETRDYDVLVKTGTKEGAGTDARVFITLKGQTGENFQARLDKLDYNDFEQGDKDFYRISTELSLGELVEIKLEHDNTEDSAGWYVEWVVVWDLNSGRGERTEENKTEYTFNRWLAKDEGSRQTHFSKRRDDYAEWSKKPAPVVSDTVGLWVKVCSGGQNCNNSVSKSLSMSDATTKIWDKTLAASFSQSIEIGSSSTAGVEKGPVSATTEVSFKSTTTIGMDASVRSAPEIVNTKTGGFTESCGATFDMINYDIDAVWQWSFSSKINGSPVVVKTCDYMCTSGVRQAGFWPGHPQNLKTCVIHRDIKYVGCYKDAKDRALGEDPIETSNSMTTRSCIATCANKGYEYAATQYGSQCFCGNDGFDKHGKADNKNNKCNMQCSGDKNAICGGSWTNSVYKVRE